MANKEVREPGQPGQKMSAQQLQEHLAAIRRSDKRTANESRNRATKIKNQLRNS